MEKDRSPLVFTVGVVLLIGGIVLASPGSPGSSGTVGAGITVIGFLAMVAATVPLLRQSGRID